MSPVDLSEYVTVAERIRLFYERYPEGSIITGEVRVTREPDDIPRVWVQAFAYRDPTDLHPTQGWSWMSLPGSSNFTRNSEIENTETSAWGRAIGALGIGVKGSIATSDEIRNKASVRADVEKGDDGSLIGNVEKGDRNTSDFEAHISPEGHNLGFRLRGEKGGILVRTVDPLASQLYEHRYEVIGKRVTVWGRVTDVPPEGKMRGYQVLTAERVRVPVLGDLPTATPEITEAESEAIWDKVEEMGA